LLAYCLPETACRLASLYAGIFACLQDRSTMISEFSLRCVARLLATTVAGSGCGAACAQAAGPELNQSFWLHLGAFRPHIDSVFRIDSNRTALPGSTINGEKDLGWADNETVGSLLLGARLGDRWRLEFEYFELDRAADAPLVERSLSIGDSSFALSARVASEFTSSVYRFTAGYSMIRLPQAEVGVAIGVHVTDFSVVIEGTAAVNGVTVARQREQRQELLPLPTAGLYGTWAFTRDWVVQGRVDWFSLSYDGYEGTLWNVQANLLYSFSPNFAVGIGYRLNDYEVKADRSNWRGEVNYRFRGPQILVEAGF